MLGIAGRLAQAGLAEASAVALQNGEATGWKKPERAALRANLTRLLHVLDASPYPEGEWAPARELLGDNLLARLVGA